MQMRRIVLHAFLGVNLVALTLGNGELALAAPSQKHDPASGPHARDEVRHGNAGLQFTPARTHIMPRREKPAAMVPVPLGAAADFVGPIQVTPAPLLADGPIVVEPAAVTSGGGLQREVFGFAPYWTLSSSGNWNFGLLSTVAYFGLDVNADGSFNTLSPGWSAWNSQELVNMINLAHQAGDRVVVVIKAFDNATINQIVTSPAATQNAINGAINAIAARGIDGVNVDFEGSSSPSFPNIQSGFTNFMSQLSRQVHQRWPSAMVSVDTYSGSASWDGGLFNIGALAPVVDAFFVMAYDMVFSNLSGQAGPNAPMSGWTYNDRSVVAQYLSKAPASKVILGVPYYGYKWSTTSNQPYGATRSGASADTYAGIVNDFSCAQATRSWDATAESPWAAWFSPASGDPCGGNFNSWRELYYDDATSLGIKYDLVNAQGLLGTGMWALGYDGASPDLWQPLAAKFSWTVSYDLSGLPLNWAVNQTQSFPVKITNTGLQTWPAAGPNPVRLGMHFASAGGQASWFSDQRFNLPTDLASGSSVTLTVSVTAPPTTQAVVLEARMVKEQQFWFNQWASVSVTMASPVWKAGYDTSGLPRIWQVNQTQTFLVTVNNGGNQAWPAGGVNLVHLGMHFATAAGQSSWLTDQRFNLPADLAPGASVTLTVSVTAPANTGGLVLEARMVKEQQFWFDQWAAVTVSAAPPLWAAGYDVSLVPRAWGMNQTQSFPLKVTNTGNQTWPAGGANPVHLGMHFASAGGQPSWFTDQRIALPADLAPGASVTLTVSASAPATTAAVVLEARMVKEWQFWFDEWAPVSVGTAQPTWAAGYDLSSMPQSWTPNQSQTFAVTVTNTGNQTWPASGTNPVHLGMHFASAGGQASWLSDQRFNLPADLAPGSSIALSVSVTAPATTGGLVLEARMVKEWQFWFDQWGPVSVTSLAP